MPDDKKLRNELLRQNGGATLPVDQIVRRERRRVRLWAVATAALWIVAVVYLFGLVWVYAVLIHPVINEFFTGEYTNPDAAAAMKPRMMVVAKLLLASLYWPALLFLAAACTLFFTLASRRATLRQIQASLAEISAQLQALAART
jgi:signal transduction histidine kinase